MQHDTQTATLSQDLLRAEACSDRFTSRRMPIPRFDQPLESQFQNETAVERLGQLTRRGLLSLVIYNLFLVSDFLMAPNHLLLAVVVRLGLVTPLALLLLWWMRRPHRTMAREATAAFLMLVIEWSVLYLRHGVDLSTSMQTESEFFLILLTMNAVLRLDMLYAFAATALSYLSYLGFLFFDLHLSNAQKLTVGGRVFWGILFTLFANYAITRERRVAWLLHLRTRIQHALLAESNAALVSLSETDRLTGLANRHAYENRLLNLWNNTAATGAPLSAVMVDVDHFKSINDDFGHSYGDRVLQRVAVLLLQGLRAEDDFVARIGGEEFIILLPGSDAAGAALVAERIRTLVQVAGSPAFTRNEPAPSAKARWSTVSCGVATTTPSRSTEPQTLIDDADRALYRAKQSGRNRVCTARPNDRLNDRTTDRIPENRISIVRRAL